MAINTKNICYGEVITLCNYCHGAKSSMTSRLASQKVSPPFIVVKLKVYCHVINSSKSCAALHNIMFFLQ
jgi:hypothetical protein